jgi:hypothetical protein
MKKRAKKTRSVKRARAGVRSPARGAVPSQIAGPAVEVFVKGVLVRGEAAKAVKGKLPPGVTHEIVGTDAGGLPIIKRRRFSVA